MPHNADIEAGMRSLITLVRNSNSLILALSGWLASYGAERTDVTHRLVDVRTRRLPRQEAEKLDLTAGTLLLRRRGELWAEPNGVPVRVATANAWVAPHRMPVDAVERIRRQPLGIALQRYGMRRVSRPPRWTTVRDAHLGRRLVVRLAATLVVNGVAWALTDETLDQSIVELAFANRFFPPTSVA